MKRELKIRARPACRYLAVMLLVAVCSLVACSETDIDSEKLNERSDFSVANQVANEYLVITALVTKSDFKPVRSQLIRGPTKANSAFPDLVVRSYVDTNLVMDYTIQDPRFIHRGEEWVELPSAEIMIFVPLSSTVDNVTIRPLDGRRGIVSKGGEFNPLTWAIIACRNAGRDFAACQPIVELGPESRVPD